MQPAVRCNFCHLFPSALQIRPVFGWQAACFIGAVPSKADLLQDRAERFAVRVLKFISTLPQTPEGDSLRRQLARSAPGISGNYRSARRGRSKAEFTSKLGVVVDEADETERWLLMVKNSGLASGSELDWLIGESGELRAIYVASYGTARRNKGRT